MVVQTALTDPQTLELPFGSWTLDRLKNSLNEVKGIAIKRSRIGEILLKEGLRWRQQERWFGVRVDPDFAQKRGRLLNSTKDRRPRASSCVSMNEDQKQEKRIQANASSMPRAKRRRRCNALNEKWIMNITARAMCLEHFVRRQEKLSRVVLRVAPQRTGLRFWTKSSSGSAHKSSACTRSWIIWQCIKGPIPCSSLWRIQDGNSSINPNVRLL